MGVLRPDSFFPAQYFGMIRRSEVEAVLVYMTAGSMEEARKIASALVEERLAACANILPQMESVYQWKGEIENDAEVVVIAKTKASLAEKLNARVLELHSYEVPCVVTMPITGGNPEFLAWIGEETQQE
jgi:periplasmic divalent cation tolerance protein